MTFSALRRLLPPAACTVALGLLLSCGEAQHIASPFTDDQGPGDDPGLAAISGRAVDVTGASLAGVRLDVRSSEIEGGSTGFADIGGRFFLPNLSLDSDIVKFSLSPQLYNANYRRLRLSPGGELHFPAVMLLPVVRGSVFYADQSGGGAVGALGSGADFPASSFITPDSTLYAERVAPYLAVTTLHDAHFAAAFPGEFLGRRTDGSAVILEVLGAMWAFVTSQAGPLALAPDVAAAYRLGVDASTGHPFPAAVPVWALDTATGRWNEIGEADLVDGVYEATASTLGPICWALPAGETCEIRGIVRDDLGQPLAGANVDYRDLSGRYRTGASTDEDGAFSLAALPGADGVLTPYFGSITGSRDTVSTAEACPLVLDEPLVLTLPSYRIDLDWSAAGGDLDAHFRIFLEEDDDLVLQWVLNYLDRGRLEAAPYARHQGDARGSGPETITGRRWYDGKVEYWVHDYARRDTEALRSSGAVVDLLINEQDWRFAVADAPLDAAVDDSSGWWHVFDIVIDGPSLAVEPRQRFAPAPGLRR